MSRQYCSDSEVTASKGSTGCRSISTFSSSANLDDDWTKISNLTERRKIQNRIAQRKFRTKLKRRLEDLRGESNPASPSQMPIELQQQQDQKGSVEESTWPEITHHQPPPRIMQTQYEPPMQDLMYKLSSEQEGYQTPAFVACHPSYPPQPHHPAVGYQCGDYLAPAPSMIHFHESGSREKDAICPFGASYQDFTGTHVHASHCQTFT